MSAPAVFSTTVTVTHVTTNGSLKLLVAKRGRAEVAEPSSASDRDGAGGASVRKGECI